MNFMSEETSLLTEWQTPHAETLIRTSPALGSSTGTSLITHGALGPSSTTALHVLGIDGAIFAIYDDGLAL